MDRSRTERPESAAQALAFIKRMMPLGSMRHLDVRVGGPRAVTELTRVLIGMGLTVEPSAAPHMLRVKFPKAS